MSKQRRLLRGTLQPALVLLALLMLCAASWLGYASYLAARENNACREPVRGAETGEPALQRVLDEYSLANEGVGLQATVVFAGGRTWSAASGYADRAQECPLTVDHHLYVGSITKLYITASVMDQVEQGTIGLDDSLEAWLDLPFAEAVTVRMLLNHTSGIPNYTKDPWFAIRYRLLPWKAWRQDELVGLIGRKPLSFEPGSQYAYSSSNYVLLVEILEAATGKTYDRLLHGDLLAEQGLRATFFLTHPDGLSIANGYDRTLLGAGPVSFGLRNVTGFRPSLAGTILSTSSDVARFARALFNGQVVDDATVDEMVALGDAIDPLVPEQTGYGLGVARMVVDGQELVGHTGVSLGYSGIVAYSERGVHHRHIEQ